MRVALDGGALAGLALSGCGSNASNPSSKSTTSIGNTDSTSPATGGTSAAAAPSTARAAVNLKGANVAILSGAYFIAPAQDLFAKQVKEWASQSGANATVDFINWPDIQAKLAAAIQAGSGPDIVPTFQYWPALSTDHMVDVGDIAEPLGSSGGDFYDASTLICKVNGKWRAVPQGFSPGVMNYRVSYPK